MKIIFKINILFFNGTFFPLKIDIESLWLTKKYLNDENMFQALKVEKNPLWLTINYLTRI